MEYPMKQSFKRSLAITAAAACFAVLLQTPAMGQKLSAEEKAKTRARNIARNIELSSRVITIYDRQGKVIKTVGPKGLYTQPVFSPVTSARRILSSRPGTSTAVRRTTAFRASGIL